MTTPGFEALQRFRLAMSLAFIANLLAIALFY